MEKLARDHRRDRRCLIGIVVGGYLFIDSQPRSLLAIANCESSCYRANDLTGLLASAGIQRTPGLIPDREGN